MGAQEDLWRAQRAMREGKRARGVCKHCLRPIAADAVGWGDSESYYCPPDEEGFRKDHEPEDIPHLQDPDEVRAWLAS